MSNKIKIALALIVIFAVLIFLTLVTKIQEHIPDNPSGVVGNTAGNLNNFGLFCERGDTVYFANAYDNGSLYSMNIDGSNLKKLGVAKVLYINADDNFLYFYQPLTSGAGGEGLGFVLGSSGLHRSDHDGKKLKCITRGVFQVISLMDNHLYLQEAVEGADTLLTYKLSRDGKAKEQISDFLMNPACCLDSKIYYNGTKEDHNLYAYADGSSSTVLEGNMWFPVVSDGYVYYIDLDTDFNLCRKSLSGGEKEILYDGRIESFNVGGGYVYFQTVDKEAPSLCRVRIDGGDFEQVMAGACNNINVTSTYTYFTIFGQSTPVYRTPTSGEVRVTTFDEARDAAVAAMK